MIWYHVCIQYKRQMIWITLFWLFAHLIQRWYVFVLIHPNHVYLKSSLYYFQSFGQDLILMNLSETTSRSHLVCQGRPPPLHQGRFRGAMGFEFTWKNGGRGCSPFLLTLHLKKFTMCKITFLSIIFFYQFHYNHNYVNFDNFKYCFI